MTRVINQSVTAISKAFLTGVAFGFGREQGREAYLLLKASISKGLATTEEKGSASKGLELKIKA